MHGSFYTLILNPFSQYLATVAKFVLPQLWHLGKSTDLHWLGRLPGFQYVTKVPCKQQKLCIIFFVINITIKTCELKARNYSYATSLMILFIINFNRSHDLKIILEIYIITNLTLWGYKLWHIFIKESLIRPSFTNWYRSVVSEVSDVQILICHSKKIQCGYAQCVRCQNFTGNMLFRVLLARGFVHPWDTSP